MKVIKPLTLGVLHKPYSYRGANQLCVVALGFFKLGVKRSRFEVETKEYPNALKYMPKGQPLDMVMPKGESEFMLCGQAHSPSGKPVAKMNAGVRVGNVSKVIGVQGNRQWYFGPLGFYKQTCPESFISMDLGYKQAYGGEDYQYNNVGKGYSSVGAGLIFGRRTGELPNLEYPEQSVVGLRNSYMPASFGPMDIMWKQRTQWVGTYDQQWIENRFPGLADDADMRLHNQAAQDQRQSDFWQAGEPYRLRGVHPQKPEITGELPQFRVKAVLQLEPPSGSAKQEPSSGSAKQGPPSGSENQKPPSESGNQSSSEYRHLDLNADTVWFFPEADLGLMLYRGTTPIAHADATDVKTLLLAYESVSESERPLAHYIEQARLRTDRDTVAGQVLNEAALIPVQPQSVLDARAQRKLAQAQKKQETSEKLIAELEKDLDIPDVPTEPQPQPSQPAPEIAIPDFSAFTLPEGLSEGLSLEDIADGGIDLSAALASIESQKAQLEAERDQALENTESQVAELLAEIEGSDSKEGTKASPEELEEAWQKALENAQHLPLDLHPGVGDLKEDVKQLIEQIESDPEQDEQPELAQLEPLQRQAKRVQTQIDESREVLPEMAAKKLGGWLVKQARGGVPLAGRNLTDVAAPRVDLSGLDMREMNFEGADLRSANFTGSDLSGANFLGAHLEAANFSGASLEDANFSQASLQGAKFESAHLKAARLVEADLRGASFVKADLTQSLLNKAQLEAADFSEANLEQTLMPEICARSSLWRAARLQQTVLMKADLRGALFLEASLERAILAEVKAQGSSWQDAKAVRSFFGGGSDFSESHWAQAEFKTCGFRGTVFAKAKAAEGTFFQCDFGDASLDEICLHKAVLCRSLFSGASLQAADMRETDLNQAICRSTDFTDADLRQANLLHTDMSNAILLNTKIQGVVEKVA